MQRENRDINVVEWANIPKFSKLDDIVTPLRLLELFSNDVLVDMTKIDCTNALSLGESASKKKNMATLNSANQAYNFDSGWLERQQVT